MSRSSRLVPLPVPWSAPGPVSCLDSRPTLWVGAALERIAAAVGEATVVVVAHGAAITLGATRLLGLDPSAWFGLRGLDNCHYAMLGSTGRSPGWRLERWNSGEERNGSGAGGALGGFLS